MNTLLLPRPFKVFTKMCVCIVTHTFQKAQANPGQKQKDKANDSALVTQFRADSNALHDFVFMLQPYPPVVPFLELLDFVTP
jgi:hypothetical protein